MDLFNISLIIVSILLITTIILQQKNAGGGGIFGGGSGGGGGSDSSFQVKRGFESFLHKATIILAILFIGIAFTRLIF